MKQRKYYSKVDHLKFSPFKFNLTFKRKLVEYNLEILSSDLKSNMKNKKVRKLNCN